MTKTACHLDKLFTIENERKIKNQNIIINPKKQSKKGEGLITSPASSVPQCAPL